MADKQTEGRAFAKLREGTEILRTGGGIYLTADECNAILDFTSDLENLLDGPVDIDDLRSYLD